MSRFGARLHRFCPMDSVLENTTVVVTGGGGYLGREITQLLLAKEVAEVRVVDVSLDGCRPDGPSGSCHNDSRVKYCECDVTEQDSMRDVILGADAVLHIASYGMSGPSMLNKQRIMHVNVGGTHVVVELCRQLGVRALVYTSTYNVVFGGKPLCGGTEENTPYFPPDEQVDEYSRTKTLAEQLVLAPHPTVRGESTGPHLRRCAIRPAAIFGEDEDRHFPRIVSLVRRGLTGFAIGDPSVLVDWVHCHNLAHAHVLAVERLLWDKTAPMVDRQAFFVSDDAPVNQFELLTPLYKAVGGHAPCFWVSTPGMLKVAYVLESLYACECLRWIFTYIPLLTRAEVNKVCVRHVVDSIHKSRRVTCC
eukprot:m.428740 g.428740  ORF g.428740 m.428740 type:complete len:363 (-) comp21382_c0_seq5:52-1140(-)